MVLNSTQQQVVTHRTGPLLVIAGPGSGKTATLIARICYLLQQPDIQPEHILGVTFTQKAAAELQQRLQQALPEQMVVPVLGTFHGLAYSLVEDSGQFIDLITEREQKNLLRSVLQQLPHLMVTVAQARLLITQAKASAAPATDQTVAELVQVYQAALAQRDQIDFDDVLLQAVTRLEQQPDVLARYQQQWQYVMVDEVQDMNAIQARLLDLLVERHRNICVIGDPDQAIYSFRGANVENFLQFQKTYPEATTIQLGHNYRSSPPIVQAAEAMISHNQERLPKTVTVERSAGEPITIITTHTDHQAAGSIIHIIQQLIGGSDFTSSQAVREAGQFHLGDIAVLYRLNRVGHIVEQVVQRSGLPYQRVGAISFFERPEIKFVLEQWQRQVARTPLPIAEQLRQVVEQQKLHDHYDVVRYDRILELIQRAMQFNHLPVEQARSQFLREISLTQVADDQPRQRNAITLSTIHSAKGLEFPVVFIAGVNEGVLPYGDNIEEERRLLYVAMTRAQDRLYIAHSEQTMPPSRFLSDIPERLLKYDVHKPAARSQLSLF